MFNDFDTQIQSDEIIPSYYYMLDEKFIEEYEEWSAEVDSNWQEPEGWSDDGLPF